MGRKRPKGRPADGKGGSKKKPPRLLRGLIAFSVLAFAALGVLLDRIIVPAGAHPLFALDMEVPGVVALGTTLSAWFHDHWPVACGAAAAIAAMVWIGALDKLLKPMLTLSAIALLCFGGIAWFSWSAQQDAGRAVQAAPR